jgi:serine/threonine-protein kinase
MVARREVRMEPGRPTAPHVGDRYEIVSFRGAGRFGELWQGRRRDDGGLVLVKVLSHDRFPDEETVKRFGREVELLRRFTHPYLPRVVAEGRTDEGDPFLVLVHEEGRLLSDVLAEGPLPIDRIRRIGAQLARLVAAASVKGIVHRGITPSAILLSPEDGVKVLDFGFARMLAGAESEPVTEIGARVGEPAYMAPETIEDFRTDSGTDLYGLGVLLYEIVAGRPPFVGTALEVLDAHTRDRPASLTAHRSDVPPWLDALVLALLAKRPEERPEPTAVARALVSGHWPLEEH